MTSFDLNSALQDAIRAHGIDTERTGDWLVLANSRLLLSGAVVRTTAGEKSVSVQVDFRLRSPLIDDKLMIESYGGTGSDDNEAARFAFDRFLQGSLHVILAVFVAVEHGVDQVEWETWNDGSRDWRVCLGPMLMRGYPTFPDGLTIGSLLDQLRALLPSDLASSLHWLRIFHFSLPANPPTSEALLDNNDWPGGRNIVHSWPWPDGGFSVRAFMMLMPVS
jgi:hypothetical protein